MIAVLFSDDVVSFLTTHPPPLLRVTPCPTRRGKVTVSDPINCGADAAVSVEPTSDQLSRN